MKKLLLALSMLTFTSVAQAGFMIEPYVGYETGSSKQSGSPDSDYTGTTLGARLGYGMLGLSFGLDYTMASGTIDETTPPDTDVDATDMGLFVSYEFPILLRVYATYILSSKADVGQPEDIEGSGMKLGVGFTGLPFVVINLEMTNRTFDEYDGQPITPEIDLNTYALVVSLPLP